MGRPAKPVPEFDDQTAWGVYRLSRRSAFALKLSHCLPSILAPLTKALRKQIKYGRILPLDIEIWGMRFRLLPRGNVSEEKLYTAPRLFDSMERNLMAEHLTSASVFVDVGANAGIYSFWANHCMDGKGRIIAVEPDVEMARRIAFNIATNNLENIDLCRVALSDHDGTAQLFVNPSQRGTNTLESDNAEPDQGMGFSTEVQVTTLLGLLRSRGITRVDMLKIDIEGHEKAVLGHFFEQAPAELYPGFVISEYKDATESGIVDILTAKGYRRKSTAKLNVIFQRDI